MMYLRLAVIAAFAVICGLTLYYRGEAIGAQADRAQAQAALSVALKVNEQNEKTIDRMLTRQRDNDKLLSDIAGQMAFINEAVMETNASITELEKVNDDVRAFMSVGIPDDLRRMLNKQ